MLRAQADIRYEMFALTSCMQALCDEDGLPQFCELL